MVGFCLAWLLLVLVGCSRVPSEDGPGNSTGNIFSLGGVAMKDGYVYYSGADGLCRMKRDGTDKVVLSGDKAFYLNVVGDTIHYHKFSLEPLEGNLWTVKTDGTGLRQIGTDNVMFLTVVDGWLYYIHYIDSEPAHRLVKTRPDRTERTILTDPGVLSFCIDGGWIYYISNTEGRNETYKVRTDGTEKTNLDLENVSQLFVTGQESYAILGNGVNLALFRVDLENGGQSKLSSVSDPRTLHVVGDWIYFYDTLQFHLYRIRKDGTEKGVVSERRGNGAFVFPDTLFLYAIDLETMSTSMYRSEPDGSGELLVETLPDS